MAASRTLKIRETVAPLASTHNSILCACVPSTLLLVFLVQKWMNTGGGIAVQASRAPIAPPEGAYLPNPILSDTFIYSYCTYYCAAFAGITCKDLSTSVRACVSIVCLFGCLPVT